MHRMFRIFLTIFTCYWCGGCTTSTAEVTDYIGRMTNQDIMTRMNRVQTFSADEGLDEPLSLAMALARAIKYNLTVEVERYNQFLGKSNLDIANLSLLPKLAVTSTRSDRDNNPSSEFNQDDQKVTTQAQALLRWSLLDYATGYIRKHQLENANFSTDERYRRTLNRIIAETRLMYFRVYYGHGSKPCPIR